MTSTDRLQRPSGKPFPWRRNPGLTPESDAHKAVAYARALNVDPINIRLTQDQTGEEAERYELGFARSVYQLMLQT